MPGSTASTRSTNTGEYPFPLNVRATWLKPRGRLESARKLYQVERQKIQDEYKKSRELVRQRVLDGLEERRRKIREDKETVNDIVAGMSVPEEGRCVLMMCLDTLNDVSSRSRGSRPTVKPTPYPHSESSATAAAAARIESLVKQADNLLASFSPAGLGTSLSIDNVISPLPYSLAVLPPPTQPDRVGKNARRGRNVVREYEGTPGLEGRTTSGNGRDVPTAETTPNTTTSGPNNTTVIRISPAMSGYAKVPGWAPGKALEDLKGLAVANEFEREGDLANMSGWGRRGRQAGKAAAAAISSRV